MLVIGAILGVWALGMLGALRMVSVNAGEV